jgi:arginase family enzyme
VHSFDHEDANGQFEFDFAYADVRRFDSATTYRPGTRFGPQAVRRISALYDGYWFEGGVDIYEELDLCDAGDIFVIPGNIEKTFDQVTEAVAYLYFRRFSHHLRRRPQPRLPQCPGHRSPHRRQCRHHPHRPPYRHPGKGYG